MITHNSIIVKGIQLEEGFSNIYGDLIINRKGRVQISSNEKHAFYTVLRELPPNILLEILKQIEDRESSRIVNTLIEKIERAALS